MRPWQSSRATFRAVALVLAISEGSACKPVERTSLDTATSELQLRDDFGAAISFDTPAKRIVSLNPTTTEILFAIGAGSKLVGRSKWDSWPDSAKYITDVGDALRPNIEAVLNRHPDLVLLYASATERPVAERLKAAGIRTVALKIDSIAQFRRATLILGRIVGDTTRARNVVDSVQGTLDRVRAATEKLAKTSVFYHTWDKPIMTIGANSFLNQLLEIAGGRNVYGDVPEISPVVTLEDIVKRNPDAVLVGPITAASILASPQWAVLPAVRAKRVFVYDTMSVGRPSVTLGMAAVDIANLLHPGIIR